MTSLAVNKFTAPDYSFQPLMVGDVWKSLRTEGRAVLAASCGAGKTKMAIDIVYKWLKANPKGNVLWLAHGQRTLRTQAIEAFKSTGKTNFTEIKGQNTDWDQRVHIALPHSIVRTKLKKNQYGLIITDEAHHFYTGEMGSAIRKANPKTWELLLTASHGRFTKQQWPVFKISLLELIERGVAMSPRISIVLSKDDWTRSLDDKGNLSSKFKFKHLTRCLTDAMKELAPKYAKRGSKHMIACHSQAAAQEAGKYLKSLGVNFKVSTTDIDVNSIGFSEFLKNKEVKVLIVVYRGVLGFNVPELETILDITGSANPDRIFQLMGRCTRAYSGKKPMYVKMASDLHAQWYRYVMSGVVCLAHPDVYNEYNGTLGSIVIPVAKSSIDGKLKIVGRESVAKKPREQKIPTFEDLPNMFRDAKSGRGEWCFVSLKDAKFELMSGMTKWTYEKCLKDAQRYGSKIKWHKGDNSISYAIAHKNKWLDKIYKNLGWTKARTLKPRQKHSLKNIILTAKKYKTAGAWTAENLGQSAYITKNKLIKKLREAVSWPERGESNRKKIKCTQTGRVFNSIVDAASKMQINTRCISCNLSNRSKKPTVSGYTFEYV